MALVTKNFSDIITFTRASTATYFDSAGVLQTAAINAPRFDYNPSTLAARGFLIEEARTNSIRNNTMVGAAAGTPGTLPTNWFSATSSNGLTRQIVGVGSENGINYIDVRYSGTTSAANLTAVYPATAAEVAALSGQTWTGSFYVSLVGGSTANTIFTVVGIDELNSGGTFLAGSNTAFTLTSGGLTGKRYTHTRALNNASTAFIRPYVFFTYNSGVAIDITLRIGLPQLELGAFETSVIPTTTTALTRSVDVAAVNTLSPWFNATEGTILVEASPQASNVASVLLADLNTTITDRISLAKLITSGNASLAVLVANVTQVSTNSGPWTATGRFAGAYKLNDFASSLNGSAAATDTSGTIPAVTQLFLGRRADGANILNGHLRRITYYPRRLSNAELQSITS